MHLLVSKQNVSVWAADYIQSCLNAFAPTQQKPFVLGLPTGGTVLDMYARLRILFQQGKIDFQHVITFNMDEYIGLSPDDPQSYHAYMQQQLFKAVNLQAQNTFLPDGCATDLAAQCRAYENAIKQAGGVRLWIGGIGHNGHIAFNEPGTPFDSRTRAVSLADRTRQANARFFNGDISRVPSQAITVGIGTLLEAQELLFLATGSQKAQAVSKACQSEIPPQWPITALRLHPRATLAVDQEASALLPSFAKAALQQAQEQYPQATCWKVEI
ncbi:MAG: glucosamine-6-phosphate deaminase [Elusimicrobiaceae bacterium]|nr:glucosamine-6-phosphate deaminase [Elusimicrobiaceae bacterium]